MMSTTTATTTATTTTVNPGMDISTDGISPLGSASSKSSSINDSSTETLAGMNSGDDSSKVSLPSIDIVLEKIESYQNQQKLSDSQLLLELTQRQDSISTPLASAKDGIQTPDPSRNATPSFSPSTHQHSQYAYPYQSGPPSSGSSSFQSTTQVQFQSESSRVFVQSSMNGELTFKSEDPSENILNGKQRSSRSQMKDSLNKEIQPTPYPGQQGSTLSRTSSVDSMDSSLQSGSNTPTSSSAISLDGSNFGSKKRTNLPRETIEILNDWILNNMDNPYPNHSQKRLLLERTGLSNVQLSNWFINKRRRRIFSKLSGNNGQPIKKKRLIDRI